MQLPYNSLFRMRGDALWWTFASHRLRILCYHGICEDRLRNEPWMPHCFVTESDFVAHLDYLRRQCNVVRLSDAARMLRNGTLPPRAVAITFDDGYANNLQLAYPLLRSNAMPATIFLSSAYLESGDFFPFLRPKLLALHGCGTADDLPSYASSPLDVLLQRADRPWSKMRPELTADQRETLRPLTLDELRSMDCGIVEFGAHSHTHCILRNESRARRDIEIRTSVRKVAEWTGHRSGVFSYPNGQSGDFDEADKNVLREEGIEAAVAGIAGANGRHTDPLEFRRYPVGLFHSEEARFSAEVSGMRTALRAIARRIGL